MPREEAPLLEVRDLSVVYGRGRAQRAALQGASFSVRRGEAVGLIGETGSGKSTLARAVLGLVPIADGSVQVAGEELTGFSARKWQAFRRKAVVQYVFQDPLRSLDPDLSAEDSIAEPLRLQGRDSREDIQVKVRQSLAPMNLDASLLTRFPGELSGGQRQRVAIARALTTQPALLILDEPVSALDSANRVQVLEILARLRASGVSLLFISHDLGSIAGITDRIMVLYRGTIAEIDATEAIVNRPSHPYTRLLVGSAPSLASGAIPRERRAQLRAELQGE
jgi:ABC-type glutathione transport system ATPase component